MAFARPAEPITGSDDDIRAALEDASIPALLPAIAMLAGDLTLLRPELRWNAERMREPNCGLTSEQVSATSDIAFDVLVRHRDGTLDAAALGEGDLETLMRYAAGGAEMGDYVGLMTEELAVSGEDLRAPSWAKQDIAPGRDFHVVVIGAGMSGLLASHRLQQAGVAHTVLEKNADVGGTWLENTYPGCRVDVPNHSYSYSFAQKDDWPHHHSTQPVLLEYFRTCADVFELRKNISFDTEVIDATFDEVANRWTVRTRGAGGESSVVADALISAVGQLNRPNVPDIAGAESFAGPMWHTSRWNHDVDLEGKRVAFIGNGATGAQAIPEVAKVASQVTVFQRTPNWFVPAEDYHAEVAPGLAWLFRHVPHYNRWYRFFLFWRGAEGVLPATEVDDGWDGDGLSVGAANQELRDLLTMYLQLQYAERPDLLAQMVPQYPPAAKRILFDNGTWASTMQRDNVSVVGEGIETMTETGVVDGAGVHHDFDVIIYATGFEASKFLTPMKLYGRDGADLHEVWDGDARAYLGLTVPSFPNFFCLYGPNTNIVVNGSIIYFSECEVHYVLDALRCILENNHGAIDCKPSVHDSYNQRIDEGNAKRAWGASSVSSWYKNDLGRVAQNWPFSLLEYWQTTQAIDPSDYEILPRNEQSQ